MENQLSANRVSSAQMYLAKYLAKGMPQGKQGYVMKYLSNCHNQQVLVAAVNDPSAYTAATAKRLS